MNKKLIVILVLIGLALILIVQNTQSVSLNFFFWSLVMPLVVLVLTIFALGFIIGFLRPRCRDPGGEKLQSRGHSKGEIPTGEEKKIEQLQERQAQISKKNSMHIIWISCLPVTGTGLGGGEEKMIEVILDASGSMNGKLGGGEVKICGRQAGGGRTGKKAAGPDGTRIPGLRPPVSPGKARLPGHPVLVPFGPLSKNRGRLKPRPKG